MQLFISYSRDDKAWVYELWRELRDRTPHNPWIDRRIVPAQDWWETILHNIEAAEAVIYIMTPKSAESIYCVAELEYAGSLNKPIVPIMLKACDVPGLIKNRRIQFQTITDQMSMVDVLLEIQVALGEVQLALFQGKYPPPDPTPNRPDEPTPAQRPEQVAEVFMMAEEAVGEANISLAEKLFQQVIDADPQGWGLAAAERLGEIRFEDARHKDYLSIVQMAHNPALRKGARAAWRAYLRRYPDYDPQNLADLLAEAPPQAAPPKVAPPAETRPAAAPTRSTTTTPIQPAPGPTRYEVILRQIGPNQANVLSAIRAVGGHDLAQAKLIFATPRSRVLEGVAEEEAQAAKARLEAEGAWVEIAPLPQASGAPLPADGTFTIILKDFGSNKIEVIKVIRALTPLGLAEAKTLVETPNAALLKNVNGNVARWAQIDLQAAGATVEIVEGKAQVEPAAATSAAGPGLYRVILVNCGPKKINVIKVIRALTNVGLAEAKTLAETPRSVILDGIDQQAAEAARKQLMAEGATVEVTSPTGQTVNTTGVRPGPTPPPNKYTVILAETGPKKINVIKVIRALTNLGLAEAKTLSETPGATVLRNVSKEAAEAAQKQLTAEGATITLVPAN